MFAWVWDTPLQDIVKPNLKTSAVKCFGYIPEA